MASEGSVQCLSKLGAGDPDLRPLQFEDSSTRPDDMFATRSLRELVDATVATLAPHHRQVFVMRELEGRSYEAPGMPSWSGSSLTSFT